MRCKVGDLCVIVKDDFPENIGKFVTISEHADPRDFYGALHEEWACQPASPLRGWTNNEMTESAVGYEDVAMNDCDLRPIRNDPGQDQTLSWKDVPQEVKA